MNTSALLPFAEMLLEITPDLVMMDINMPVMGGIETTQKAMKKFPDLKVIVLTTFHDEQYS